LSPDGRTLAVCHLPEQRIELFDVTTGRPVVLGDVPVGIDPVSVRWRSPAELWVVNHISSSISVVDVARRLVVATRQTRAGPADVVFAGTPSRAYVSCARENVIQVFHPDSRLLLTNLTVLGDRPQALAISPDGARVYVAIFESGNASTILTPEVTSIEQTPSGAGVLADSGGPHQGIDPPPNRGTVLHPPMAPYLETNALPVGSLIVKKNSGGRWMDDNDGDWTEFISGAKAARSGRVTGWDMPDRDLAIIDTSTHEIRYATGLMNLCMTLAVNPASGQIAVVGTDGRNEVRFEPNLRGVFLRVNLALVDPQVLTRSVYDLNPHLDYTTGRIAPEERAKSLGDPRGIAWNAAGTRGYVTGMGSHNLIVIDGQGRRVREEAIDLPEGPTGLALDERRERIYILNRFSSSLSVVDASSLVVVTNLPLFDPTPTNIQAGRRLFYDTRGQSGLGQASCASCHPEARFDRLAWDLGAPSGGMTLNRMIAGRVIKPLHPMKGPMVTLTLQGIIGLEPFHWRGDRDSLLDFHVTFTDLLGADRLPTVREMRQLEAFLNSVRFPPNFYRQTDNTLSPDVPLPGHFGLTKDEQGRPRPLPNGSAVRGLDLFLKRDLPEVPPRFQELVRCATCHDCNSFSSKEQVIVELPRNRDLPFRSPALRSVGEKVGMDLGAHESRAGFGFMHDGRVDTLTRFLATGFGFNDDQDIADLIAFLLSAPGGDLYGCAGDSQHGVSDAPAAVGRQVTLTAPGLTDELVSLIELVGIEPPRRALEIVVRGQQGGTNRGWYVNGAGGPPWSSDRNEEGLSSDDLVALASPETPLTFTVVMAGTSRRLGVDRDEDGRYDRSELDEGTDPQDWSSPSSQPPPAPYPSNPGRTIYFSAFAGEYLDQPLDTYAESEPRHPERRIQFSFRDPTEAPAGARISADGTRLLWLVPSTQTNQSWNIHLRVEDNARPEPDEFELRLNAGPFDLTIGPNSFGPFVAIDWFGGVFRPTARYEVLGAETMAGPWERLGFVHFSGPWLDAYSDLGRPRRFYRVVATE
jgi:DNA-binding beta-propeller fold protein YncE